MTESHLVQYQIKASTPTVKAHNDRLVDTGLVNSVKPEIDSSRIDFHKRKQVLSEENIKQMTEQNKLLGIRIRNLKIKMLCEYCTGSINSKPKLLEFANF
jgi:hypothetical protein